MTEKEMRKLKQSCHEALLDVIPDTISDAEIMHLYLSIAHLLISECTQWSIQDMERKNEDA